MDKLLEDPFGPDLERTLERILNSTIKGPLTGGRATKHSKPTTATKSVSVQSKNAHLQRALANALQQNHYQAAMDVVETDKAYVIHADAPGLSSDDIKVTVQDGILTITGTRKRPLEDADVPGNKVIHRERSVFHFTRAFDLPEDCNVEQISATMDNKGVLKVLISKLEKKEGRTEPRRIRVMSKL